MSDTLLQILVLVATNAVTWFFTRHRQKAEVKQIDLDNIQKQFETYAQMAKESAERQQQLEIKLRTTNQFVTDVFNMICGDLKCTKRISVNVYYDEYGPHLKRIDEDGKI